MNFNIGRRFEIYELQALWRGQSNWLWKCGVKHGHWL